MFAKKSKSEKYERNLELEIVRLQEIDFDKTKNEWTTYGCDFFFHLLSYNEILKYEVSLGPIKVDSQIMYCTFFSFCVVLAFNI